MQSLALVVAVLVTSCNAPSCAAFRREEPPPDPSTVILPPQPLDGCEQESAHIGPNGLNCPEWSTTYVENCESLDRHIAEEHQAQADHSCVIGAASCEVARGCQ